MRRSNITKGAKVSASGKAGVCQAKVIRAETGQVEYHYSVSVVPWWRMSRRAWGQRWYIYRALRNFRSKEST